ncbi:hypothetical protein PIB30_057415 [Stylosanthes scabra]|uniref:Uncharacterized protein n=1 Tax=Stylosanthes scabra TaxID=79078 RepID=A0ABU6ZIB2_9FABA|nr:hypothetical protein [Stylosanthes scabra]
MLTSSETVESIVAVAPPIVVLPECNEEAVSDALSLESPAMVIVLPCAHFSSSVVAAVPSLFAQSQSGFLLDYLWFHCSFKALCL